MWKFLIFLRESIFNEIKGTRDSLHHQYLKLTSKIAYLQKYYESFCVKIVTKKK